MSLSEPIPSANRRRGLALLLLGALLGACTVRPLYGPTIQGSLLATDLSTIHVVPSGSRVEQEIINRLIFAFTGGANPPPPRYNLRILSSQSEQPLGVTSIQTAPSYSITLEVSYELTDIAAKRIVTRGVASGTASFDRSNQAFANVRAQRDAEDRAAGAAADEVRLRIAAAVVTGNR